MEFLESLQPLFFLVISKFIFVLLILAFIVISLICLVKKNFFNALTKTLLLLCCIGIYFTTPAFLFWCGNLLKNPVVIKTAADISLFGFEKNFCYGSMGVIYATSHSPYIDGNLAITYLEKANNKKFMPLLLHLYFLKGEHKKVFEIEKKIKYISLTPYVFVLKGEYENALKSFSQKNKLFLKDKLMVMALNKELGNLEQAKAIEEEVIKGELAKKNIAYTGQELLTIFNRSRRSYISVYSNVEKYRRETLKERKKYKF